MRTLTLIDRIIGWIAAAMSMLAAAVTLIMTAIVGYGVFMRYLLNQPQVWTDELVSYLVVLAVMLAAAETLRRDEHISVDLLTERLGPRGQWLVELCGMAAVAVVSLLLLISGLEMVQFSHMLGIRSTGYLAVPVWQPQAAVPFGFALLLIAALNGLLRTLLRLGNPGTKESPGTE